MGSICEGVFTVEVEKLKKLLHDGKSNESLFNLRDFERMYCEKHPFTLGNVNFEIRMYPFGGCVEFHVLLSSNVELVKKFGYITMYRKPHSRFWSIYDSRIDGNDFKADTIGEEMGLPMVKTVGFVIENWRLDGVYDFDNLGFKLILRLILDDSRKPSKPEQAVSPPVEDHPNQTKVCSSNLSTALLSEEFADIHFVVNGERFPAHSVVLASSSSVFRSELLALQGELSQNGVFVSMQQHMDTLTFKYLLHFIYTETLPSDLEKATNSQQRYRSLFIAAHLFKVERLKIICEEKLSGAVIDGILSTLDLMDFNDGGHVLKIVQKDAI